MASARHHSRMSGPETGAAPCVQGGVRAGAGLLRGWLALLALVAALVLRPGVALAGFWSDDAAAYGLEGELDELGAARERIARHEALRAELRRRLVQMSGEIGILGRHGERARAETALRGHALQVAERALDRAAPRLVARLRAAEQRRAQAARALTDLAGLSRRQELDPQARARLRAVGPVLLAALRSDEALSAALTRRLDRLVEREGRLAALVPELRSEIKRLDGRREALLERRRQARQRLAGLDAELHRLGQVVVALAGPLLVVEAARRGRVEAGAAQPARERAAGVAAGGVVRGQVGGTDGGASAARIGAQAAMSAALADRRVAAPVQPAAVVVARQDAPWIGRVGLERHDRAMTDAPRMPAGPVSSIAATASVASRVAAQLPPPAPITPVRAVAQRLPAHGELGGMTIGALPGQRVAAPQDGRIVFADAFKGYGLLLIIEHDSEYHTLLWGFSRLRVAVGDAVRGGEIVGVMDVIGGSLPRLGVELRRRGRPVNSLPWLAASSSKVRG